MADWVDTYLRRDARDRRADRDVPPSLPLLGATQRQALKRWASKERAVCRRLTLLKEAEPATIEEAETLRERLLAEGWIECREQLTGGTWQWDSLRWRDLPRLQELLGIESPLARERRREDALAQAEAWLAQGVAVEPDVLDALQAALAALQADKTLPLASLLTRLDLLKALADWQSAGLEGSQRDFALHARGETKALGAAEWRWLGQCFDLERLRISPFAPMLAVSGPIELHWDERRLDLGVLHFAQLPLSDVLRATGISGALQGWWLIENRASFERQARLAREAWMASERLNSTIPVRAELVEARPELSRRARPEPSRRAQGERFQLGGRADRDAANEANGPQRIIVWLPGRPSQAWLAAWSHALRLLPAPVAVSADADPAGVDIACTVGACCEQAGVPWLPEQMGVAQLEAATQHWPLNDHDLALLQRLLARPGLPAPLHALCVAMQREGRKAEQEGWL